jgi:hypothetical protein
MLRLALLLLYLTALFSASTHTKGGGGLDPDGLTAQTAGDLTGNLDPNGRQAQAPTPATDIGGGLDPNGGR